MRLVALLNGELDTPAVEALLDHLDACPVCAEDFRGLLAIRTMAPELAAGLPAAGRPTRPGRLGGRAWVGLAAAAVLLVAGLFLVRGWLPEPAGGRLAGLLEREPYVYVPGVYRGAGAGEPNPRADVMVLYEQGRYADFVTAADAWLRKQGDDPVVRFHSGVACYLLGRWEPAERRLGGVTGDAVDPAAVSWYLANTRLARGDRDGARPVLDDLAEQDHPYAARARALLAALDADPPGKR